MVPVLKNLQNVLSHCITRVLELTGSPLVVALFLIFMPYAGGFCGQKGWEVPFATLLTLPLLAVSVRAGSLLNPAPLLAFHRGKETAETYQARTHQRVAEIRQKILYMLLWGLIILISTGAYLASLPTGK